jgi:DNA-binding NarL/FixJ family response regulator
MDREGVKIRVLLVDDQRVIREGLAGLLRFEPDIEVVGEAADGHQAIALAEQLRPDVITMDVSMPGMNGMEATRAIISRMPQARIIGLSMHLDDYVATAMMDAGAVGYLTKSGPPEALVAAIRRHRRA